MNQEFATDYESYRELMEELLLPIQGHGLSSDTLKRLYESKLVYLENLRLKCFREMNDGSERAMFRPSDYERILLAQARTKEHMRLVVVGLITSTLNKVSRRTI